MIFILGFFDVKKGKVLLIASPTAAKIRTVSIRVSESVGRIVVLRLGLSKQLLLLELGEKLCYRLAYPLFPFFRLRLSTQQGFIHTLSPIFLVDFKWNINQVPATSSPYSSLLLTAFTLHPYGMAWMEGKKLRQVCKYHFCSSNKHEKARAGAHLPPHTSMTGTLDMLSPQEKYIIIFPSSLTTFPFPIQSDYPSFWISWSSIECTEEGTLVTQRNSVCMPVLERGEWKLHALHLKFPQTFIHYGHHHHRHHHHQQHLQVCMVTKIWALIRYSLKRAWSHINLEVW